MLPPFDNIPHELTHFTVNVDFANGTCNSPDQRFLLLHSTLVLNFPASNMVLRFITYRCSYKNKAHTLVVMGSFCFLLQLSQPFNLSYKDYDSIVRYIKHALIIFYILCNQKALIMFTKIRRMMNIYYDLLMIPSMPQPMISDQKNWHEKVTIRPVSIWIFLWKRQIIQNITAVKTC